jgi:hypothetical protein
MQARRKQYSVIITSVITAVMACGCNLSEPKAAASPASTSASASSAKSKVQAPVKQKLTWPNSVSHTNSDQWLRDNHSDIAELRPNVLLIIANNADTPVHVASFAGKVIAAFQEGSRYHGYKDNAALPQLNYQIAKTVDLRDNSVTDWPAVWPTQGGGGNPQFNYEGLFSAAFAQNYGYADPLVPNRFLTLCELFEKGIINELWVSAPRGTSGNPIGVYESKARVKIYNAAGNPTGGFDSCAGNGCFDPGVAGRCNVSVRLMELATDRGPGCATHAAGHGMEGLRHAVPAYATNSARFFGFELNTRYGLPIPDLYNQCEYFGRECWSYATDHTLSRSAAGGASVADFTFAAWGSGCGNIHFPPNATGHYDYSNFTQVRSSCEDYGGHHGRNGADAQTQYSASLVANYDLVYGDCGGGWQTYMRQSIPGYGAGGTGDDGKPQLSWWPYLYY